MANQSVSVGRDNRGIINQGDHSIIYQVTNHYHNQHNQAITIPDIYNASIVSIHNTDNQIIATGFLVTSNYIITTYQNIAHLDNLTITFALRSPQSSFEATLIDFNETYNIALLQIDSDAPFFINIIKHQSKETTQPFTTLGFAQKSIKQIEGRAINNFLQIEDSLNLSLSGSPLWSTTHNGIMGMMVVEDSQASMIPISKIIEAFKPLQEALRNWIWQSSFKSVDRGQISIFAMVETLIAMSIALSLWYYYDTFIHILIGLAIAPFLLLRTEKSTKKGLKLFESIVDKSNHYKLYKALLILTPILVFILYHLINSLVISLGLVLPIITTQIFFNREMNRLRGLVLLVFPTIFLYFIIADWVYLYTVVLVFTIILSLKSENDSDRFETLFVLPSFVVIAIGTLLLAVYTKVYAILSTLSQNSLKTIPKNYKRYLFYIDFMTPPELLPNIEKTNLNEYKYTTILKQNDINKITLFIFTITLFLPVMLYRYSIKATALFYLPLLWLISTPKDKTLTQRMEIESQSFWAYLMFFYSLIIVFVFTILPIYLNIYQDSIRAYIPAFISPDIYTIFFAVEFNLWHLTRLISALITILFVWQLPRILKMREINHTYGDHWGAKFLDLTKVRTICTLFTLLITLYLIYQAVPKGYIQAMWDNMKLLPI